MRTVYLHGELGEKFGTEFYCDVSGIPEAMSFLAANFGQDFTKFIRGNDPKNPKHYEVLIGDKQVDKHELRWQNSGDIHLIPVIEGAKEGAMIAKTVVGVALLAVGVGGAILAAQAGTTIAFGATAFTMAGMEVTFGTIALAGFALAAGGISAMTTAVPKVSGYEGREAVDQQKSNLFGGATNSSQQGQAIPLIYGRMQTGSIVMSAGMQAEQVKI